MRKSTIFGGKAPNAEALREALDSGGSDERDYRRGYQQGANDAFEAVQAFLTPQQKAAMSTWIDDIGANRRSAEELPSAPILPKGK
jgi:hypothetical protein